MEELLQRLSGLQVGGTDNDSVKVLTDTSLEGVAEHIKKLASEENCKKIIVMTGAGISTAAGIPDFRSPGTGLYDNLQQYNLPDPMSIFDINFFASNPKPFFHLGKELYPGRFKPTISHYFIKLLEQKGLLLRNFTQNIDTLERRAGISDEVLMEAHGAFNTAHCITCGKEYSKEYVKEKMFNDEIPLCTVPECAKVPKDDEKYTGIIKPDIVFFGESLPGRFAQLVEQDTKNCELLIVMGTSLVVQPFASVASRVNPACPRLLINLEKVGESDPIMAMLGFGAGFNFSGYRDVFECSTCDDGVLKLTKSLGWNDELLKLYHDEHARLDSEMIKEGFASSKTTSQDKQQPLSTEKKTTN